MTGASKLTVDMKIFVSRNIVREWRTLGRHLLSDNCDFTRVEAIIKNIDYGHPETQEKCYQIITKWEEMNSSSATAEALVAALRSMEKNLVAWELEKMIGVTKSGRCSCTEKYIQSSDWVNCRHKLER